MSCTNWPGQLWEHTLKNLFFSLGVSWWTAKARNDWSVLLRRGRIRNIQVASRNLAVGWQKSLELGEPRASTLCLQWEETRPGSLSARKLNLKCMLRRNKVSCTYWSRSWAERGTKGLLLRLIWTNSSVASSKKEMTHKRALYFVKAIRWVYSEFGKSYCSRSKKRHSRFSFKCVQDANPIGSLPRCIIYQSHRPSTITM